MCPKGYRTAEWLRRRPPDKRGGQARHSDDFNHAPGNLAAYVDEYLQWMRDHNYARGSIDGRRCDLRDFLRWTHERDLLTPEQCARPVLESYQRSLARARKRGGNPLTVTTQRARIGSIQQLFSWLCKRHIIAANPAADLELPRPEKRLHVEALSISQVESLMSVPDPGDPIGIRDRTILETLYSTGIRRSELTGLELADLNYERRTLRVRGKGNKDRVVPIGQRALRWVTKYLEDVRPLLMVHQDEPALFLTAYGAAFNPDVLSRRVSAMMRKAELGRPGSCHLLRHSCATHMLEGGADIRFIQELLGHTKLETTAIYTEVTITQLQAVHARTHPAERSEAPRSSGAAEKRENPIES